MRAAVLEAFGSPLSARDVPDPMLGTGEVIVDVVAAGVLPYAAEVFSGHRQYALTLPVVPGAGAVGRVRAIGPDATRLAEGDWVLCDPTIRSRDGGLLAADLRAGEAVLADLVRRFGPRVRPVRAAAMTVREFGRVVLMGGGVILGATS
jgi:NADPH:quinone reductase-like Zn-dependent oxidoreductase